MGQRAVIGRLGGAAFVLLMLCGCETVAITAMGVGVSAGVSHTANSIGARTFTVPTAPVKAASLVALERMGITIEAIDQRETGELIKGTTADRWIEVEIERMSKTTTHLRVLAKRGWFVYDGATAREIIAQTELALAAHEAQHGRAAAATTARVAEAPPH